MTATAPAVPVHDVAEAVTPEVIATATRVGLRVRAGAAWPEPADADSAPPAVAGFVLSSFSPLVAAVADRCLARLAASGAATPGERTAVCLISGSGDLASAVHVAREVDAGRRPGPLLFFQSVPNAVAGYVAARHDLRGPVLCLAPAKDGLVTGLDAVSLLVADGDADHALVVLVEQDSADPSRGHALALLVSSARNDLGGSP